MAKKIAVDRTRPGGQVVGIDVIPAQPPRGVSTIQGNFLSPTVQEQVKRLVWSLDLDITSQSPGDVPVHFSETQQASENSSNKQDDWRLDSGRLSANDSRKSLLEVQLDQHSLNQGSKRDRVKSVDIILSDMSEPWVQADGFWKRSLNDPYYRMMNTSGMSFRDHAGSMDLCLAALNFARDMLKEGGHFICKFYQGSEDKQLEITLKQTFMKVFREKPESSRNVSSH